MIKIDFPKNELNIKKENGTDKVFDPLRKKWLQLTKEEWVRQNFLQYLTQIRNYPSSLIAIEKEIKVGELKKRCDIVIYNREHIPWMIVECKEMDVQLGPAVLDQALRYHITLLCDYLVITNGSYTYGFKKEGIEFIEIDKLPEFNIQ